MKTEFLDDAKKFLDGYGLLGSDHWYMDYLEKLDSMGEGKSVLVSRYAGVFVHMMRRNGGLVFFTDQDAKSRHIKGDGVYFSSLDYEAYLERTRVEEPVEEKVPKKRNRWGGGSNLGQSLAQMLTSLDLIPETNTACRRYFYDFLEGLGLLGEDRRPTPKAVEMGYVQEAEGVRSWYEWDMDFFSSQIGCDRLGGYMSKHKIHETLNMACDLDKNRTLALLAEAMEPYSDGYMVPNRMAIESGRVRLRKYYEWHPECLSEICGYFLELKEVSKSKKISLEEAKSHLSWMGEKGMAPGEEGPMGLLMELDPECFEKLNSIQAD